MKVEPSVGQATGSTFWLMVQSGPDRLEPLTIDDNKGRRVLPVFSFKEEAEMFLRLGGFGDDWFTRESSSGELVSVLFGPCANVRSVALDPLPEMVAQETIGFVSVGRERFVERLVSKERLLVVGPDRAPRAQKLQ